MTGRQLNIILIILILLIGGASIAAVVFGDSLIEEKSQEIVNLKAESKALEEQQLSLLQARKDVERYSEFEVIAKSVVPQEKDQARAVREIVKLAAETNIPISNIIFPASDLGQTSTLKRTEPKPPGGNSSRAAPTSQVSPVEGISGVFQMEINVQSATQKPVPYESMLAFLAALEQNRRTAHITNLSVTPNSDDRGLVTFSLTINTYLRP